MTRNGSLIHILHSDFSKVIFFITIVPSNCNRDCFRDCDSRGVWGNLKIKLLDTMVWQKLREKPEYFHERYQAKANLLESDFVLMPMFDVRE